jgi:hypothetical protein
MKPTSVVIRSTKDGAEMILIAASDPASDRFDISVTTPAVSATRSSSTYLVGSPASFFDGLSASWHGWEGERTWSTLEEDFRLAARSDHLGHIEMLVRMKSDSSPADWEVSVRLHLEAGGLDRLAGEIRQVFPVD